MGEALDVGDLDALQALYDAAKPGGLERVRDNDDLYITSTSRGLVASTELLYSEGGLDDADLIVAAVNALPALIERVRQLEAAQQWEYAVLDENGEPWEYGEELDVARRVAHEEDGSLVRRRAAIPGPWGPIPDTEEPE